MIYYIKNNEAISTVGIVDTVVDPPCIYSPISYNDFFSHIIVGFDPTALSPDGMTIPGATGIIYPGHNPLQDPKVQGEDKSGGNKDNKKDSKKGRATFSGNQIDELEKAFQTTQYLTNSERSRIAERLSLSENQVKIWFQNRRTKCRRTAWKTPGMTSPTTTTAPPTVLSSDSTTASSATQ